MGSVVVDAVTAAKDMEVACGSTRLVEKHLLLPIKVLMRHFQGSSFDVLVDFTSLALLPRLWKGPLPAGRGLRCGNNGMSR